jgi:hypothetical protein
VSYAVQEQRFNHSMAGMVFVDACNELEYHWQRFDASSRKCLWGIHTTGQALYIPDCVHVRLGVCCGTTPDFNLGPVSLIVS